MCSKSVRNDLNPKQEALKDACQRFPYLTAAYLKEGLGSEFIYIYTYVYIKADTLYLKLLK